MTDYKIGIIGLGYVGKAIKNCFISKYDLYTFDINKNCTEKNLDSLIKKSNIIFICLPTPMKKDGTCNTDIINGVLNEINNIIVDNDLNRDKTVVIKSTIIPGSSRKFSDKYEELNIVFNPEFLTEANGNDDFLNQKRIILGGEYFSEIKNLYSISFPDAEIIVLSYEESEMVKYFSNAFLATKVSFANEIFILCKKMNIDYDLVVKAAIKDDRIGNSHLSVPGPDGKYGFGGSCLPKDLLALISFFNSNNVDSVLLNSVWKRNSKIDRKEKDWELLKGRAVE